MPPGPVAPFLEALRDHSLLTPAQHDEVTRRLAPQMTDPRVLARHLLQQGWLTPYQVNQLFLGKGAELVMAPYLLLERLGEGGTGQVFKARHQQMHRIVALKLIRPELLTDPEVVQRFYREVQVLSQLSHPNVVHAYDAGPIGATHFLVMEYVEGTDLSQLVKRNGPLAVDRACNYIRQAACGLAHAHEKGLVHRDIKPSNLLLTGNGERGTRNENDGGSTFHVPRSALVKILDLGLARLRQGADGEITSTLTPVGSGSVTMGTPDYLAPEQALDFHQVDIRADIYSLGCTFFYLLTGQPPFPGGSMAQKLMRHQQVPPPPLGKFRTDVPPGVEAVLQRMLAKRPGDRFQTPGELATSLAESRRLRGTGIRADPPHRCPADDLVFGSPGQAAAAGPGWGRSPFGPPGRGWRGPDSERWQEAHRFACNCSSSRWDGDHRFHPDNADLGSLPAPGKRAVRAPGPAGGARRAPRSGETHPAAWQPSQGQPTLSAKSGQRFPGPI